MVDEAETLFDELTRSASEPVLLHGDLHHFNILAAAREPWLAIDPQGVVGERAYEVGALLRNPMPQLLTWPRLRRVQTRRVEQLADELDFDRQRLRGWAFAQAVLSAWWSFEDTGKDWEQGIAVAESL
jgi:streptomycin 6-kinase